MEEETKENLLIYGICVAVVILTIAVIINIIFLGSIPNKINLSEELNCSKELNCSNKDIFTLSYCMEKELEEFYNYNLSNAGKNLNLSQLKEQGGVCEHASNYYKDNFLNLGARENKQEKSQPIEKTNPKYYISKIVFSIDNETSHAISIVSNKNGWCALDQLEVKCWRFK